MKHSNDAGDFKTHGLCLRWLNNTYSDFNNVMAAVESHLVSVYSGKIKQFTIDKIQNWAEEIDEDWDSIPAAAYRYGALLDVMIAGSPDRNCIAVLHKHALEYTRKIQAYSDKQIKVTKAHRCLNEAAKEEGFDGWNEVINNYKDSTKSNVGRGLIDDIIVNAFLKYDQPQWQHQKTTISGHYEASMDVTSCLQRRN